MNLLLNHQITLLIQILITTTTKQKRKKPTKAEKIVVEKRLSDNCAFKDEILGDIDYLHHAQSESMFKKAILLFKRKWLSFNDEIVSQKQLKL